VELSNPPGGRRRGWKKTLIGLGLVVFTIGCMASGAGLYLAQKFAGQRGFHPLIAVGRAAHYADVAFNPAQTFPGRRRINLLCLGLDRNWTRKDMPYTKGARSDTMMVASLDLERRAVSVLSIPRDTWVELPGAHRHAKINDAFARGGAPYAIQTAEEFLGAKIDYYVVIKQEAIQGAIDQLGGLNVPVEKSMNYDDNWGHLHVHLKSGQQRLTGEQTVGYMLPARRGE